MKVTEIIAKGKNQPTIIRFAAYCRVSSDSEDQLHSFAAQIRYYKDYERKRPEYRLVDIYADEGITGTCMEKRDEFNRLIRDCKKGKIDRIVVKSVSRFARNTEELLVTLRMLKGIGVSVYFEEQGIDTDKMNMEMIVTFPGIPATIDPVKEIQKAYRQLRVAAYCRVSTQQEEQLNSYDVQKRYYTEKINSESKWTMVGIFADKGITGTSTKKRDEFNKMIRLCKKGKVDMIIVKSISRFARNTVDCLNHVRMLKDLGVDVFFEEQGIHSTQEGAEFYITIYGSIAQSESENISANVRWGKTQSAKEGNVAFRYKNFLGYRKGADGKPEIEPEGAEIVRLIYERFLAGDSFGRIAAHLEAQGIKTPAGKDKWQLSTIQAILRNERYKGDAILGKTYVVDCLSKKVKVNNGERPKYYVENNHPAIIDAVTFGRVQEELARRNGKRKVKQVGTKTEQGRYCCKYALTELLVCGECGTPYRRCTWTINGQKKIVWRCINRLDFGKKYCHESPSVEEGALHRAIMTAIFDQAKQNTDVLRVLQNHIAMGLSAQSSENEALNIQFRIAEINATFQQMLKAVSSENADDFDEAKFQDLMFERDCLQQKLDRIADAEQKRKNAKSRLDEIFTILDGLKNHPMEYDDQIARQILECVVVESKTRIKVVFVGGLEVEEEL